MTFFYLKVSFFVIRAHLDVSELRPFLLLEEAKSTNPRTGNDARGVPGEPK